MMSATTMGIIGIAVLMILLMLGTHIGYAMAIVGFAGFVLIGGLDGGLGNLFLVPFSNMNNYYFAVVPLFQLMSEFVGRSSMGTEMYEAARAWLGRLKGGLAMATIGASGLFSCVSGSSLAGSIVMARVAFPEMERCGYDSGLSTAVIAIGGTLGILIPPSMGFIVIGILADLSIGKLFLAGIFPGISAVACYLITILILCKLRPNVAPGTTKTTTLEKVKSLRLTWPVVLIFGIMMVGIYGGVFTATEAAGIGAFAVLIISLARRQMGTRDFWQACMDTSKTTGMLIIMIVGAMMFNAFLAITRIPNDLGLIMAALPMSKYTLLILIIIFYLIMGMFFDIYAILILTIPIFYPAVKLMGFDLIWYSVLMVRCVEVGLVSPPFGLNLFILRGIINVSLRTAFIGIIPFIISDVVNIAMLIAFPAISTFLPSLM